VRNVWGTNKSFVSYFDLVFVLVSWISRRESSGYTFATITQTYEVFQCIFVANTVAHVHRQAGQVRSSTACVFRNRGAPSRPVSCSCYTVARCPLVRNSLQSTDKLSAVSYDPLSLSRHNAGYRSRKVGHEINVGESVLFLSVCTLDELP